jgi:CDP-glucose 4,6-dehydratase
MNTNFWKEKRVFLTGHTGFKGSWTVLCLQKLGAIVKGYSLKPNTTPSLFEIANISDGIESEFGDVRDLEGLKKSLSDFLPEIVIHMAAQPLVRLSYQQPVQTYQTNIMGTVNLFEAIRVCDSVIAVVNVTTDPYSSSKGCSELVTSAYQRSFFGDNNNVCLASARAGNVIGGGDWSQDRLIPDALHAFGHNQPLLIRNPQATRPWQHVLEPISGYLMLAENLYLKGKDYAEAWNFGPNEDCVRSVGEMMDSFVSLWPGDVSWELDSSDQPYEAELLKLDISKVKMRLKWKPTWDLNKTLKSIIHWHQSWLNDEDMRSVTLGQIDDYKNSFEKMNNETH